MLWFYALFYAVKSFYVWQETLVNSPIAQAFSRFYQHKILKSMKIYNSINELLNKIWINEHEHKLVDNNQQRGDIVCKGISPILWARFGYSIIKSYILTYCTTAILFASWLIAIESYGVQSNLWFRNAIALNCN